MASNKPSPPRSSILQKPRRTRRGALSMYPGRVNGGTIDTGRPDCSAAVSESGDTVETKRAAHRFSAIRVRPLNDPRQGSLPTVLLHLDQVQTGHPSPSAHQFRLPFNGLSPSELRRIFCSDEGDARGGGVSKCLNICEPLSDKINNTFTLRLPCRSMDMRQLWQSLTSRVRTSYSSS